MCRVQAKRSGPLPLAPSPRAHPVVRQIFTIARARDIRDDDLASLSGRSVRAIREWRYGKSQPRFDEVADIADVLGLAVVLDYKDTLKETER